MTDLNQQLTQLEQTIIEHARGYLADVIRFYEQHKARSNNNADRDDYKRDRAALNALLALGHQHGAGMCDDARAALLAVEDADAAAFREHCCDDKRALYATYATSEPVVVTGSVKIIPPCQPVECSDAPSSPPLSRWRNR